VKIKKSGSHTPTKSDTAGDLAKFFGSFPPGAKIRYEVGVEYIGYGMAERAVPALNEIRAEWEDNL
jgi:hypothetical protein